jgi:hypothetical protein
MFSFIENSPVAGSSEKEVFVTTTKSPNPPLQSNHLHFVSRGYALPSSDATSDDQIVGYDSSLMRDRTLLRSDEERRLLRRIDWHLLPLLAAMYMVKTIDAANVGRILGKDAKLKFIKTNVLLKVSNARIMDKGTSRNILTELHITSNQYNLVTVCYYV